jgi:hypothetical protein
MYKIGIVGSSDGNYTQKIRDFLFKVKSAFGDTATVFGGGSQSGIEYDAKKYALEFGLNYKEFNPSYTGHNVYSFLPESYFGKRKHESHYLHRYQELLLRVDKLIIGASDKELDWKLFEAVRKKAEKRGIEVVFV